MSLSSSIEFETRSRQNGGQIIPDDVHLPNEEYCQRKEPPRVRYPTPDDISRTTDVSDESGGRHKVVIIPIKMIGKDYHPRPQSDSSDLQESLPSSSAPDGLPAMYGTVKSDTSSASAHIPVPLSVEESRFSGDESIPISVEIGTRTDGPSLLINGEKFEEEEENEDGFVVVPERENTKGQLQADRFGFIGGTVNEVKISVDVFRRRESKWLEMLDNWQYYMSRRFDKVKARCRKGIPSSVRPRAWKYLCGAQFFMTSSKTKNIFETLDKHPGDPHWNSEILKDLNRQFPNHELFSQSTPYGKFGQEDLFRILKAWTLLHPEEGYCQAQAPIASALLMHMPAHEAFYCFAQICQKYLPGYFSPGLEAVQMDGDILFGLLKKHSYSSYKHLKKQNIDPVLYMVEWFMCIFCRTLPWPCVLRVLDMFFCEGVKILFKVAVYLFKDGLSSRLQLKACPSMYETVERLRHLPLDNLDETNFVRKIAELDITDQDLERVHYKLVNAKKKQKQRSNNTV